MSIQHVAILLLIAVAGCSSPDATPVETSGASVEAAPAEGDTTASAGDPSEFCRLADEAVTVIEQLSSDPAADLDALSLRLQRLSVELEASAPDEIAGVVSSTDPTDAEPLADYLRDECGLELPEE